MTDLFREAEDELRKEKAESLAKRTAPFFFGAVIAAVLGGLGWQFWQSQQAQGVEKAAVAYDAAMAKLQGGDLPGGAAALEAIAKDAPGGFATVAALQRAAVLQEQGKNPEALAAYDAAAKAAKDVDLADLARLRAAYIAADIETKDQLKARLAPIIDRKGAFAPLARELSAASLWAAGDGAAARSEYSLLQLDLNAPEGVRSRAAQAIAVIDAAATPSDIPMVMPTQGQDGQGQPTPAQIAQAQAAQQQAAQQAQGGENGAVRVVRLPPGVKLPPGFKVPPNVRVIETPLPAGAKAPAAPQGAGGGVPADVLAQIERERQASMARQKAVTEAQQKQVEAITKAQEQGSVPANAPTPTPGAAKIDDGLAKLKEAAPTPSEPAAAPSEAPKSEGGQ